MVILGLDYGKKKVGLAIADFSLAQPLTVVKYNSSSSLLNTINQIIQKWNVEQIVVGISEGEMANETRRFGKILKKKFKLPVVYQDETLSTKQAQELSIEARIRRSKRKALEDAYSATIILQAFIDDESLTSTNR